MGQFVAPGVILVEPRLTPGERNHVSLRIAEDVI